ncbi:AMP-binding protein [Streptomyces beijiangensis]|uniref:AMP-binding protein n=1 Tax=Streptomyces beijiangensis TaxID=163361 RepID=UPI0027DBC6F2|nr:AMP-binding protein [Streptomyces beijiangensis]
MAILLGNRVEAVESLLAVTRASGVGVPLDPGSSGAELARLLEDCGARVLITDEARLTHRRGLLSRPGLIVVVAEGGEEDGDTPLPRPHPPMLRSPRTAECPRPPHRPRPPPRSARGGTAVPADASAGLHR